MNEGWASFWHFTLMHELYREGLINEGYVLEFLHSHSNVVFQPDFDDPRYQGINPYTLGFNIYRDIRRICEQPTPEDRFWFPDLAGSDWLKTLHHAMTQYKDESFILQFLSPGVMRDMRLFCIDDDHRQAFLEVSAIHDDSGYKALRESLSNQYNLGSLEPDIQIYNVDVKGDRSLTLIHSMHMGQNLHGDTAMEILKHLHLLWGFDVRLNSVDASGEVQHSFCNSEAC